MDLPKPRSDLLERPIGTELALFDVERGIVHTLNPSATVVWQTLSHSSDISELVAALREAFEISAEEASAGVEAALQQFMDLNLVTEDS
jgi:PqqD family protein of HPr-rel-A system